MTLTLFQAGTIIEKIEFMIGLNVLANFGPSEMDTPDARLIDIFCATINKLAWPKMRNDTKK